MPKVDNNEKEKLQKLEKLVKKVIRKSLKNNTLDYTVQFTVSNLEPGKVKYATMISSPSQGVQPITFVFDSYEALEACLKESETEIDLKKVEMTFHESRINTYESKIMQHKERLVMLENGEVEEDEDDELDIPMEIV